MFYILDGDFSFTLGTDELDVGAGSLVFIPRGTRHGFKAGPGAGAASDDSIRSRRVLRGTGHGSGGRPVQRGDARRTSWEVRLLPSWCLAVPATKQRSSTPLSH